MKTEQLLKAKVLINALHLCHGRTQVIQLRERLVLLSTLDVLRKRLSEKHKCECYFTYSENKHLRG